MDKKKVHFMGLGGAGISAVAAIAQSQGYEISGCDIDETSPFLKHLNLSEKEFYPNHSQEHVKDIDLLVISPAIESLDPNNLELKKAKQDGTAVLIGEEFLAKHLVEGKKIIAVSGTHGKSTTTSMIGKILEDAGFDPSVLVGAIVKDWDKNFRVGKGDYFVLEADEYQEKFLLYHPFISVVTAMEMDHPEYFKDVDQIKLAFKKFIDNTDKDGYVILGENVELEVDNVKVKRFGIDFQTSEAPLKLLGDFNQKNAAIAKEVSELIGVGAEVVKNSLKGFNGVGRRFDFYGEANGVKIFDDYAHHPTAIKATMAAAKNFFPNEKIWLVYQPHMYSRTKYLFDNFVEVFSDLPAYQTILVDIYAARQENTENIQSSDIVKKINKDQVVYISNIEQVADYLLPKLGFGDIVIVMGAGDIYKLSPLIMSKLSSKQDG